MLPFSHIGLGLTLTKPFTWDYPLPRWAIAFGTILPDLLDKPLYYGLTLITGLKGAELGLISSTRTFGHTGLLCLILLGSAFFSKKPALRLILTAIALGDSTHLFLDQIGDILRPAAELTITDQVSALFFPFQGLRFPVLPYSSFKSHSQNAFSQSMIFTEVLGLALLGWEIFGNTILKKWRIPKA